MFDLDDYKDNSFLPEEICIERAGGRFEFSTKFIYIYMTMMTHLGS